jgi:uncharacterized protein
LDDTVAASLGFSTPIFDGVDTNRATLAVTFESVTDRRCLTIVANHLKSKGSAPSSGVNMDIGDGQGAWNARRTQAVEAVVEWMKTDPTEVTCAREMMLGDMNAYARETPLQTFADAGYKSVESDSAYSYVFDGQIGTLDYILVNEEMEKDINKAGVWHINEDEADALDYQIRFGRPASYFDGTVPYRSSDHSPILVGLKVGGATPMEGPSKIPVEGPAKASKGSKTPPGKASKVAKKKKVKQLELFWLTPKRRGTLKNQSSNSHT